MIILDILYIYSLEVCNIDKVTKYIASHNYWMWFGIMVAIFPSKLLP